MFQMVGLNKVEEVQGKDNKTKRKNWVNISDRH